MLFGRSLSFSYDLVSFPITTCYWMHVVVVWVTGTARSLLTFIRCLFFVVVLILSSMVSAY